MSWLLVLLAAVGAVFFLWRARQQSRGRFEEILEREARERRGGGGGAKGPPSSIRKDV